MLLGAFRVAVLFIVSLAMPSAVSSNEINLQCSGFELIERLKDPINYAHCATDGVGCRRWAGEQLARQCVSENIPGCKRQRIDYNRLLPPELRACDNDKFPVLMHLAETVEGELPTADVARRTLDVPFTTARRIAAELNDIHGHSWPIGCNQSLTASVEAEDQTCFVRQTERKLSLVSGLAAILYEVME